MRSKVQNVIGLMSGTSLDGLDIAYCVFNKTNGSYTYELGHCSTIAYPKNLSNQLAHAIELPREELASLDWELGNFIGKATNDFIGEYALNVDLICSHGHTVFHQPEIGVTKQIGNGNVINEITKIPVVNDFRSLDVSLGGQGAPLVPIGDKLLFSEFENCINLGGIANISLDKNGDRVAWDICPMNLVLNHLSRRLGLEYDSGGEIAKSGQVIKSLLDQLNALEYYNTPAPKSLGLEWIQKNIYPLIKEGSSADLMRTCLEHIIIQISKAVIPGKVLLTGGGTHNTFLIEQLKSNLNVIIPAKKVIDFKEALIFGFLGYLKIHNEINVLKSVTGAETDSVSGVLIDQFKE